MDGEQPRYSLDHKKTQHELHLPWRPGVAGTVRLPNRRRYRAQWRWYFCSHYFLIRLNDRNSPAESARKHLSMADTVDTYSPVTRLLHAAVPARRSHRLEA